ncbi:hypothetical protein I546_0429 [Mycobacterium kansasii 732]|nr:hypothetical protein I546_0429 [Mycobacterium kansasii 732]
MRLAADDDLGFSRRGRVLLDAGADVELEAALGDVVELDDGPDLLSLEHPATPATMVAAPTAINNSRFTKFSFG